MREEGLKEAGKTGDGREFHKQKVEGKKPSLNRLILAFNKCLMKIVCKIVNKSTNKSS